MFRSLTLSGAATNKRLTTLAQLKTDLGLGDDADTSYGRMIDIASNQISLFLRPSDEQNGDASVAIQTFQEVFYDIGVRSEVTLGRWPLGEVDSISENGVSISRLNEDDSVNATFAENYIVKKSNGQIMKHKSGHPVAILAPLIITYTAGWVLPGDEGRNLPYAIENACILQVQQKLSQTQTGTDIGGPLKAVDIDGFGSFQFSDQSTSKENALSYEIRTMLSRFKLPVFA